MPDLVKCYNPAFPVPEDAEYNGVSLRGYIAAQVLQGLLAGGSRPGNSFPDKTMEGNWRRAVARQAVLIADELIAALNTSEQHSNGEPSPALSV